MTRPSLLVVAPRNFPLRVIVGEMSMQLKALVKGLKTPTQSASTGAKTTSPLLAVVAPPNLLTELIVLEMSTQLKLFVVPLQTPSRRFPAPQMALLQAAQVPAAVVDAPCRYRPVLHAGWAMQEYPLDEPEHEPLRYFAAPQSPLEHVLHWKPLVVPEQLPERYCPTPQLLLVHEEHE